MNASIARLRDRLRVVVAQLLEDARPARTATVEAAPAEEVAPLAADQAERARLAGCRR